MSENKVKNAIEKRILPITIPNIIACIILSAISLLLCLGILFMQLTKQGNLGLLIFPLIVLLVAFYPVLFRYKLTPYFSNKSVIEKLEVLKALDTNINAKWSVWPFTISNANFYRFYYQPSWWGSSYVVSIIYSDNGYYINCHYARHLWGDSSQRTNEIIEMIKKLEAEL